MDRNEFGQGGDKPKDVPFVVRNVNSQCPCLPLLKSQDEVETHRNKMHEGDLLMSQIKMKLENIEEKVDKLEISIDKNFESFRKDIDELRLKPAKRWDGLITIIITLIAGAIFGLVVSRIGL